jgi:AraC-like DNA-binding protein
MTAVFEGRASDSPYIERVWRGWFEEDYPVICPADTHWNLLFLKRSGRVRIASEGAVSQSISKLEIEGSEFLVIQFKLGVFMPRLAADRLLDRSITLDQDTGQFFCMDGAAWQIPDFDNTEDFVERMVRQKTLDCDPVVRAVVSGDSVSLSERTVRRRFLHATGLTLNTIQQIDRARRAAALIERQMLIPETAYELGYADQAHLTRSLRRYIGHTPAALARFIPREICPICSRRSLFIDLCSCCAKKR